MTIPINRPHFDICALLPEHRLVLVLTPKAASSAIRKAINARYGVEAPRDGTNIFSVVSLPVVQRIVPDWHRAMFVRNPFDRLVSCYEHQIVQDNLQSAARLRKLGFDAGMTFEEFLWRVLKDTEADEHFALQAWQSDRVDFLGRTESIEADWTRLRETFGLPFPDLEIVNRCDQRAGAPYRAYYTDEWRERIERAYAVDLDAFGYRF